VIGEKIGHSHHIGCAPIVSHISAAEMGHRFKAFSTFALHLRHFNILVGPNKSGKSTILAAFRILAARDAEG
jgi:predicted ATP-dependent endonuclease of OLD family